MNKQPSEMLAETDHAHPELSEDHFNLTSLNFKILGPKEKEARSIGDCSPIFQKNVKDLMMPPSGAYTPGDLDRNTNGAEKVQNVKILTQGKTVEVGKSAADKLKSMKLGGSTSKISARSPLEHERKQHERFMEKLLKPYN